VENFIYRTVTTDCDDHVGLLRLRAKATRITAFPGHINFNTMSEPALLCHGRSQRLAVGYFAINHQAQEFLGHHRTHASTAFGQR
jgi:hypothetical protein